MFKRSSGSAGETAGGWQKARRGGDSMSELPRLEKGVIGIGSLDDIAEEKKYWMSKSPLERLEAIEINRRMIYGHARATSRLQRLFEIAELS